MSFLLPSVLRVLIVDDIPDMRRAMRRIVEGLSAEGANGVSIHMAESGEEAIAAIAGQPYDLVLCDYNLGEGKDGQQVLEEVRHRQLLGVSSVFLMVTAESERPMVLGALEYQPDEYLIKPIQRDVAARRIRRAMERKRNMKELDEALLARDHACAIEICEQQARQYPDQATELTRIKADLLISMGDYEQAEAIYSAELVGKDCRWARFGLGRVYVLREQHHEARNMLDQIVYDSRYYLEAYDWLADVHEAEGSYQLAQVTLQMAVDLSPKSVRRQRRLGDLALRNGQPVIAEAAYRRAIREGSGSCFAGATEYLQLAELLVERTPSKAQAVLREGRIGLRGSPDEELRVAVGQVFMHFKNSARSEAANHLTQALAIYPRCTPDLPTESQLELARACFMLGNIEQGLEVLRRAMRDAADDARLMSIAKSLLGEFGVDVEFDKMVEQSRAEIMRINNMGVRFFDQGKDEEAVKLLMTAADRLPRNRTINMNAVKMLLNFMIRGAAKDSYRPAIARYLDRLCKLGDRSEQFRQVQRAYRGLIASSRSGLLTGATAAGAAKQ